MMKTLTASFHARDYDGSKLPLDALRATWTSSSASAPTFVMQLDQCIGYRRRKRPWLRLRNCRGSGPSVCCAAHTREDQALFAIVQGRHASRPAPRSVKRLIEIDAASRAAGHKGFRAMALAAIRWASRTT